MYGPADHFPVFGMHEFEKFINVQPLAWRDPEEFVRLLSCPYVTCFWFQGPQAGVGRCGGQTQPCFTVAQLLVGALSLECVCKYLRQQLKPLQERFGTGSYLPGCIETDDAEYRSTPNRKRKSQS